MNVQANQVKRGDVVVFNAFKLRVESEPITQNGKTMLSGRISTDGCPLVARSYLANKEMRIIRAS